MLAAVDSKNAARNQLLSSLIKTPKMLREKAPENLSSWSSSPSAWVSFGIPWAAPDDHDGAQWSKRRPQGI